MRAGVVDAVAVAVGVGPLVGAIGRAAAAPGTEGLDPVVQAALWCDRVGRGLARWSGVVVGHDVVEVGTRVGGAVAPREDAMRVAQQDVLADPRVPFEGLGTTT